MNIASKAAYLQGYLAASELEDTKQTHIIEELLDLVSEMANKITILEEENIELRDYIEELDEDLGMLEEEVYFVDEDGDFEYDDLNEDDELEYDEDDDSEYYELECPSCGEIVCFDDSLDPDKLVCPACGEKIGDIEFCDGDCDSCDEDCSGSDDEE